MRVSHFLSSLILISVLGCGKRTSQIPLESIELIRGDITLCGSNQFGEVKFSVSCNESVRETFDLAISLLHSFEYEEAEKAFVKIIEEEPECVMAYWGVAMSIYHSLWSPPSNKDLKRAHNILSVAENLDRTEREDDYLRAIRSYFTDWETIDESTRAASYLHKMNEIYVKYPEDTEAAIFYALALNATADPFDKTYRNQRMAGTILEGIFPNQPRHPGIAHYLIHNYDNPELADKALNVARQYAEIAPSSAHAQHMPSHIFTRLGLWEESIQSNINSAGAAVCYAEANQMNGHWTKELHAISYMIYAFLQKGDNQSAEEQYNYVRTMENVYPLWDHRAAAYPFAAIPARLALENKNWERASKINIQTSNIEWDNFPWQKAIVHFARSLGASNTGDITKAGAELDTLKRLHSKLSVNDNQYFADQVAIQVKSCEAWLNYARGNHEMALKLMQEAARMEDNTEKASVTPGEVIPAGELLGDLLMKIDRPQQALTAYEESLRLNPNRFNGIYGAGLSAKLIGDNEKAAQYFNELMELTRASGTDRPELVTAQKYLEAML